MANRYIYVKSRARWYVVDTADRDARNTFAGAEIRGRIVAEYPTRDEARVACQQRNALTASTPAPSARGA